MDLLAALCSKNKRVYLLHPLFDAFIEMKWKKTCVPYYFYLLWTLFYTFITTIHCLEQFSFLHESIPENFFKPFVTVILPILAAEKIFEIFMMIHIVLDYLKRTGGMSKKICWIVLLANFLRVIVWSLSHPTLLAMLIFFDFGCADVQEECYERRIVAAIMISSSSFHNLVVLSQIPSIGIHLMMIRRVMYSAVKFFLTFGVIFIAFCLVFHLLLPYTASFDTLGNAFIKVCAMLMGELDFTNSFVKNPEAGIVAKIFFFIFLVTMALVFMNLLLGIAVSDIHELERISKTNSIMIRIMNIEYTERFCLALR